MQKTTFHITQMDCPSEEQMIRMQLEGIEGLAHLECDIPGRELEVFHKGALEEISHALADLKLGETMLGTEASDFSPPSDARQQKRLLWYVLAINAAFFIIEMATGLWSRSMGLVADSLDMLADAFVYGLALLAVGGTVVRKKRIAGYAGYAQITLAVLGIAEVIRRFLGFEAYPDAATMGTVSFFALLGNALCLYLLQRSKSQEAHMQASMIFTSNDILINLGVILAAGLVWWLDSRLPDLIVGSLVFLLVLQGARRILALAK